VKSLCIIILCALSFCQPAAVLAEEHFDFAVIYPDQPGSQEEAQPIMDAFAQYLKDKLGAAASITGVYFNQRQAALDYIAKSTPQWGILSLGFYAELQQTPPHQAEPLASTRPSGFSKDVWRLAVIKTGPDDWQKLSGDISGTMLSATDASACILFRVRPSALPFSLKGSSRPLRALRDVERGKVSGVILDKLQYSAMESLPVAEKVKVILKTGDLPTAPVVWFGPLDDKALRLQKALLDMASDPKAESLLQTLQTQGFGEPDPDLPAFRLDSHEKCFQ